MKKKIVTLMSMILVIFTVLCGCADDSVVTVQSTTTISSVATGDPDVTPNDIYNYQISKWELCGALNLKTILGEMDGVNHMSTGVNHHVMAEADDGSFYVAFTKHEDGRDKICLMKKYGDSFIYLDDCEISAYPEGMEINGEKTEFYSPAPLEIAFDKNFVPYIFGYLDGEIVVYKYENAENTIEEVCKYKLYEKENLHMNRALHFASDGKSERVYFTLTHTSYVIEDGSYIFDERNSVVEIGFFDFATNSIKATTIENIPVEIITPCYSKYNDTLYCIIKSFDMRKKETYVTLQKILFDENGEAEFQKIVAVEEWKNKTNCEPDCIYDASNITVGEDGNVYMLYIKNPKQAYSKTLCLATLIDEEVLVKRELKFANEENKSDLLLNVSNIFIYGDSLYYFERRNDSLESVAIASVDLKSFEVLAVNQINLPESTEQINTGIKIFFREEPCDSLLDWNVHVIYARVSEQGIEDFRLCVRRCEYIYFSLSRDGR